MNLLVYELYSAHHSSRSTVREVLTFTVVTSVHIIPVWKCVFWRNHWS